MFPGRTQYVASSCAQSELVVSGAACFDWPPMWEPKYRLTSPIKIFHNRYFDCLPRAKCRGSAGDTSYYSWGWQLQLDISYHGDQLPAAWLETYLSPPAQSGDIWSVKTVVGRGTGNTFTIWITPELMSHCHHWAESA